MVLILLENCPYAWLIKLYSQTNRITKITYVLLLQLNLRGNCTPLCAVLKVSTSFWKKKMYFFVLNVMQFCQRHFCHIYECMRGVFWCMWGWMLVCVWSLDINLCQALHKCNQNMFFLSNHPHLWFVFHHYRWFFFLKINIRKNFVDYLKH